MLNHCAHGFPLFLRLQSKVIVVEQGVTLYSTEVQQLSNIIQLLMLVADEHCDIFEFCLVQDEHAATELARISGQFAELEEQPENPSSNKGDDLLAMMDDL